MNNEFDNSNQDDDKDNQQGHLFNDLLPMTLDDDLKSAPHQEDNKQSAANKKPRAINIDEDPPAESSNVGFDDMDHAAPVGPQ